MKNVCIFGDSITWGAIDREGGWVQRLRKHIETNNYPYEIYNLGVSGDTSAGLLSRFDSEAKSRGAQIIIIAIGINDSAYIKEQNDTIIPISQYKENIKKLIQKAQSFTQNIVFISLTKVNERETQPYLESSTGKRYSNENIVKFTTALKNIVLKNNILYIDVFESLTEHDLEDGLHPNSAGHAKLFTTISKALISNIIFSQ